MGGGGNDGGGDGEGGKSEVAFFPRGGVERKVGAGEECGVG